jgi:protease-4
LIVALLVDLVRVLLWPLRRLARALGPRRLVLTLDLEGRPADLDGLVATPRARWLVRAPRRATLDDVRELARRLGSDPRVAGVVVTLRSLRGGAATAGALRDALVALRASGKDVVAHLPDGADSEALRVATAARLVVVGPGTTVAPIGYAAESRYLRRALDRAGLVPEVYARGTYKSAGESLTRDSMSEPQREQLDALLGARHEALVSALAEGRRVDRDRAARFVDEAPYPARDAVAAGLVDRAAYDDELVPLVEGAAAGTPVVDALRWLGAARSRELVRLRSPGVIGVIPIHGPIVSRAPFALGPVAVEARVVAALRAARASRRVRGVVLHIDSPGGSAVASDRIHRAIVRLAEVKPVVACLGDVAASGGYYAAVGAHSIIARPETVTGSVGVVSARLVLAPLLERLGVATEVVRRGAHADFLSSSRAASDAERAAIERELDAFYDRFLAVVAEGRRRPVAEIEPLAGGRVWAGVHAHERGLVDALGGFERAVEEVRARLGAGASRLEPRVVHAPRVPPAPPEAPPPIAALATAALGPLAELALLAAGDATVLAYAPAARGLGRP